MNEKFEGLVEHLLDGSIFLKEAIEVLERRMIQRAMERTDGNQSEASKQLGIHRNTLQRKLVVYGLGCHRARAQRKAVSRRLQRLGPEHPGTLTSLNNLALVLKSKGAHTGAEPLYRRALEAREPVLGPEHPDTLTSVNNLAGLLKEKDDLR